MIWLYLQKAMYRPCDLDLWPMKVNIFLCIEYHPINILHKFQIDISSNSWEIKYQNIGRTTHTHTHRQTHTHTHRQTDRQTGWKQYLATPSGGEVISPSPVSLENVLRQQYPVRCEHASSLTVSVQCVCPYMPTYMLIWCRATYWPNDRIRTRTGRLIVN